MAKITYENKVALDENANVDPINKVRDIDMNEIKQVVNQNDDNVGDLSSLETTIKTSIVNAINEVLNSIPTLSNTQGTSQTDGYVQEYINTALSNVSSSIPTMATTKGTSTTNGYAQSYINSAISGTSLYSSSSGTTGNVNLSSSAANYDYLEIYYKDNDGYYNSAKIKSPNGKVVLLFAGTTNSSGYWMKCRNVKINGTTISTYENRYGQYARDGYTYANYIYITDVIGYK